MAHIAIEIGATLDSDGMELIFLNRSGASGVDKWEKAEKLFKIPPAGSTPLAQATQKAFARAKDKPLLVLIATGTRAFVCATKLI